MTLGKMQNFKWNILTKGPFGSLMEYQQEGCVMTWKSLRNTLICLVIFGALGLVVGLVVLGAPPGLHYHF
ncbi:hypothetical protein COB52_03215 [Candidatus Kaiserbacteria bacterium]|nr:MAG: hypothetical protein COB52_03215 [Candidatus Kaiserbacteria bacterium]